MSTKNQLTPHGKLAVGIFVVVGLATFVFGAIRLANSAAAPFAKRGGGTYKTVEDLEKERIEKMKTEDTDKDTVNDYDELYIFRTSPFLEDTDSDGFNDGVEIASNNDPNCPKGKECRQVAAVAPVAAAPSAAPNFDPGAGGSDAALSAGAMADDSEPVSAEEGARANLALTEAFGSDYSKLSAQEVSLILAEMPAVILRKLLLDLGIPQDVLEQTDDTTLRELLSQTLVDAKTPSGSAPTSTQ